MILGKKKGRENIKLYDPKKIYLLTTEIISDSDDGSDAVSRSITHYFLATKEKGKFYELFSKVEIKYPDNMAPGFTFRKFNRPMIKEVESLKKNVVNPNKKLSAKDLFYFLNMLNAKPKVLEFPDETKEDEE